MAYFIAGTSAFLSSLCYSEYAVEFPVAGGSFTFILYTFGEFWAWITATNLIFNYGASFVSRARPRLQAVSVHSICTRGQQKCRSEPTSCCIVGDSVPAEQHDGCC